MFVPEDDLRQIMADETANLYAAPDLVDRVLRSSRRKKRKRVRLTALAAAVAVVGAVAPAYLISGPGSVTVQGSGSGGPVTTSQTSQPDTTSQAVPEPSAIDDTPQPFPSKLPDLGDLGDGRAFGHVKVGYVPHGLQWSHWSVNFGDRYATAWDYDGDGKGIYCVEIYVYEGPAVREVDDRVQSYRADGGAPGGIKGMPYASKVRSVTIGGRTAYLVTQAIGEDGMKGTPSIFLSVGEERRVEVMISPAYAKKLSSAKAIDRELKKIAQGLTADD